MHMNAQDVQSNLMHFLYPVHPPNHLVNRLPSTGPWDPLYPIVAVVGFEGRGMQSRKQAGVLTAEED